MFIPWWGLMLIILGAISVGASGMAFYVAHLIGGSPGWE